MQQVIFILGSGHCGSTLLDLILGSHSDSLSLGEFQRLSSVIDETSTPTVCGVCPADCPVWNETSLMSVMKRFFSRGSFFNKLRRKIINTCDTPYRQIMRSTSNSILIDSSKSAGWVANQIHPAIKLRNIRPRIVFLTRDGRAVSSAYHRKYPDRGLQAIAEDWVDGTKELEKFFKEYPADDKIQVSYEALATNPEQCVREICRKFSIAFEPAMLRYWEHDHHHMFGNGGTRNLIYRFRKKFKPASAALEDRIESAKQHYSAEYYDQVDVAIKLDQRWREELSAEQLADFERVAGVANKPYAYGD